VICITDQVITTNQTEAIFWVMALSLGCFFLRFFITWIFPQKTDQINKVVKRHKFIINKIITEKDNHLIV